MATDEGVEHEPVDRQDEAAARHAAPGALDETIASGEVRPAHIGIARSQKRELEAGERNVSPRPDPVPHGVRGVGVCEGGALHGRGVIDERHDEPVPIVEMVAEGPVRQARALLGGADRYRARPAFTEQGETRVE